MPERRPQAAAHRGGSESAAADDAAVLPARDQSGERSRPRQDREGRAGQHRGGRAWRWPRCPILVERGVVSREFAPEIALRRLRFFRDSPHGPEPDATGYKGFYYHFLDMKTGRRVWNCELSTIDSAFLFAGMLTCAAYFDADDRGGGRGPTVWRDELFRRADWQWALNGGPAVSHGWRPETGFIPHHWKGYDEALLRVHPRPRLAELSRCRTRATPRTARPTNGGRSTGARCSTPGPLFTHQLSHLWIDFRGIRDAFMREHGTDYFENSRQATYVHREYAIRNPLGFAGYGEHCWGITASDGPGWTTRHGERGRTAVLRLHRPRSARRSRRRNARALGRARLAAVRAGDRDPDHRPHGAAQPRA